MSLFRYNPSDPNVAGQLEYPRIQESRREADYTRCALISDMVIIINLNLDRALLSRNPGPEKQFFGYESDVIKNVDSLLVYVICVTVGNVTWTVERRYSEFSRFDKKRFKNLKQSFLPSKRPLARKDENFVKKRRAELEQYLRTVFELEILLQNKRSSSKIPLAIYKEIQSICDDLARDLVSNGDKYINSGEFYQCDPVQLFAITERLTLAEPTCSADGPDFDFGHILDFCQRLTNLKILGSISRYGASNILPNNLEFDLSVFKKIKSLWVSGAAKPVVTLNFTGNKLTNIDHLQHLTHLNELNLSHNSIEKIFDWHQKLGNIKRLILAANKLKSIEGLQKLYSLEYLDLRNNRLVQTIDIRPIGNLPCLKVLLLAGNPLEASVEYRSRILEWFTDRAAEVVLDDQVTSPRELDTVGVRVAIRRAREDREKQLRLAKDRIDHALNMIVDPPYSADSSSSFEKDATP
uniref:PX domain-containing protein n=1 Tax=Romanomermis culicivorax TaxID=13658 RepID=A0A915KPC9_ROMCU